LPLSTWPWSFEGEEPALAGAAAAAIQHAAAVAEITIHAPMRTEVN
jgi:hypothetical protein